MKPRCSNQRNRALTLFEAGVVVAAVMFLLAMFLPSLLKPRHHPSGINCANNLKQIAIACRIWEGDNGDILPTGISVTNGGSMEMVQTGNVVLTFQVMSNELGTPKILICPEDKTKTWSTAGWPTNEFAALANSNISYFVGVDVTNDANPQMLLSGDSNFQIGGVPVKPGLLSVWTNDPVVWSAARHAHMGNLGLVDGSVQSVTTTGLRGYFVQTDVATNRLAIP